MKKIVWTLQILFIVWVGIIGAISSFSLILSIPWASKLIYGQEIARTYAVMVIVCLISVIILIYFAENIILSSVFGLGISAVFLIIGIYTSVNLNSCGSCMHIIVPSLLLVNSIIEIGLAFKERSVVKKWKEANNK